MGRRDNTGGMPSQRQLRVGELVRRSIAEILADWTPDTNEMSQVSVTVGEVRMSSDLRGATVFVLPLGGKRTEDVIGQLNAERQMIRRELGRDLHLKYLPRLNFVADRVFDQMDETRRLLDLDVVRKDTGQAGGVEPERE